jgi:hypothetical protein
VTQPPALFDPIGSGQSRVSILWEF